VYDQIRRSLIIRRADTAIGVISGSATTQAPPASTGVEAVVSLLELLSLELTEAARVLRAGTGR